MPTLTILGDSYSTFAGYIPEGQEIYYPKDILDVTAVEETWWHILCARHGLTLLRNDSWSGSTVSTRVRPEHTVDASFLRRMAVTLNGDPAADVIVLFGGTNDAWTACPLGEHRTADYTEASDRDFLSAYDHLLDYVTAHNPHSRIIAAVNCDLPEEYMAGMAESCAHFGVTCVMLHDIGKEWGHPTVTGMKQIAEQIGAAL